MYPGITDLLNDLFGTRFTFSFPPSFGTLVAISFLLAAWTLGSELKRREKAGTLKPKTRKYTEGLPAGKTELVGNFIYGFIVGFKLVYIVFNSTLFFENPQKALFSTDGNIYAGLIFGTLFLWMKYREMEKKRLPQPVVKEEIVYPHLLVSEITIAAALDGLLGAKIFHVLEYWNDFIADPVGMFFSGSGLTMYGGLIVGAVAVLWYGKKNNIPPLELCDAAAPGLMLAYGTGRLGCQLAGDGDWGIVNNMPKPSFLNFLPDWFWSYTYPHNVINDGIPIEGCTGNHCYQLAEGVFPTPLYESIVCILLFFFLWSIRKKINVPGKLFSIYLLLNGIERFLVELIRVNSKYSLGGIEFSQGQLISSLLVVAGIAGIVYFKRKPAKNE